METLALIVFECMVTGVEVGKGRREREREVTPKC